jgi:polyferredoxin
MIYCSADGSFIMTHPGLPESWGLAILALMLLTLVWTVRTPLAVPGAGRPVLRLPLIGSGVKAVGPGLLLALKLVTVSLFLLVIAAGLFGTPIPEKNLATVLTWNLWWAGLVFSIFFLGSTWCAVCPWDALAQWLVRRKIWGRAEPSNSLNLVVPRGLRGVWPALGLLVGLTWLELGLGVTLDPYATALLALLIVVLATASLALFRRKAFCHYFCPVGRTVGAYAQLAAVELRPIDADLCARCKTLDCHHGNHAVEPCPTGLVMGRLTQNTYCTSCGNCAQSCPHSNVAWHLRPPGIEAEQGARPHWDEAVFMLALLALTTLHGLSMMAFWEDWMRALARAIGDSGRLLWSFSLGLAVCLAAVAGAYALMAAATRRLTRSRLPFTRFLATFAFVALPLAFAYHMAHNLNHLVRESAGVSQVLQNPLGAGALLFSMAEKQVRHMNLLLWQDTLFAMQAGLLVLGFLVAVRIVRRRGAAVLETQRAGQVWRLLPMLLFAAGITGFNLWLLMQPMVMRL